ncbi:hypothetical protein JCGZ_11772 [Jatropha curcas]|uniref:Uncharacterized protein n=2 Tax=Jatropha curcas TaxID=180498 RepID=A0A067K591_JATCU|nr:hypothetical protein JCGZ_11772 [Jatropha curcas]
MTILTTGTHVLIFPFPAQGHMIPLLDLTHNLANRGLTITILVTPKNLPPLNPLLSAHPFIKTLVFPFPSHPSIPSGVENLKDLPNKRIAFTMIRALGQFYQPLLNWFKSHPSPPLAVISDMFLGWTHRLATELNIRRIFFSPSGAMALSVMYSLWRDMPKPKTTNENEVISFPEIPDCPRYPWWQISPFYRSYVEGDPDSEFNKDAFRSNFLSWGLVINSFTQLEAIYLDYLRKELGYDRVWAVGPLHPASHAGPMDRGGPSYIPVNDITTWLDRCEHLQRKVIYVCFGSQTELTNNQIEEVASSLESSNVNFIWCV